MKELKVILPALFLTTILLALRTSLTYKMEDLTSPKFAKAVDLTGWVCVIPLGVIEKSMP